MTRWGLLADIHGNRSALESALARFRAAGVERIAVLGDNLGRGDSDSCIRLIRSVADLSVVGNRDLDWRDRVGDEARAYVLGLPRQAQDRDLLFSHGDSRLTPALGSNDIPRDFKRARVAMAAAQARIWTFGHTHRARVWRLAGDAAAELLYDAATDAPPARVLLAPVPGESRCRWAINVGSVGLPFPGKGPASAAILNWEDAGRCWIEFFPL